MPDSTAALINSLTNPPNPLNQFGGTLDLANKLKDFQANKEIANIYSQSIDPETGQVDFGKFNALAQSNPAAMWKFGGSQQQAGHGALAQGQGTSEQLATTQRQIEAVGTQLAPLVAKVQAGLTVSKEEVQAALEQAKGLGLPASTINNVQRQLDAIPPGGSANGLVLGMNFGHSTGQEILRSTTPGTTGLPTGGGTLFISPNRLSPGSNVSPGNYVPNTLTPGEQIQTLEVPLRGNQKAVVPQAIAAQGGAAIEKWLIDTYPGQYTPGSYRPQAAPAPSQPQAPPIISAPTTAAPPASGRGPTATGPGSYPRQVPVPTPAPSAAPAPTPPPAPSTEGKPAWLQPPDEVPPPPEAGRAGVTSTPQYQTSVNTVTQAAADNAKGLANLRGATTDQIPLYDDIERVLNQPGVVSGVGAPQISKLRQAAINLGLVADTPGQKVDLSSPQAAQEEFVKDSALLTRAGIGAMGNPTDARQELITESTPGTALSKQGNLNITRMLKGNAQAIQVMDKAWNQAQKEAKWTAGGSETNNFNTWRNNRFLATDEKTGGRFDPTVFWVANQPNLAAQKEYISKISDPAAQQQLIKNLKYAAQQGWIKKRDDGSVMVVPP